MSVGAGWQTEQALLDVQLPPLMPSRAICRACQLGTPQRHLCWPHVACLPCRAGNIGDGESQDRHLPTRVKGLDGVKVAQVACGWRHRCGAGRGGTGCVRL